MNTEELFKKIEQSVEDMKSEKIRISGMAEILQDMLRSKPAETILDAEEMDPTVSRMLEITEGDDRNDCIVALVNEKRELLQYKLEVMLGK